MFIDATPGAPPRLLIDASGDAPQVGLWQSHGVWLDLRRADGDALENLFRLVEQLLADHHLRVAELGGFVHCQGPGSLLGLRLAAMAVESWRALTPVPPPLFQYHSLSMAAALHGVGTHERDFTVISVFRRDVFNVLRVDASELGPLELCPTDEVLAELAVNPVYLLPQRRLPAPLPPEVRPLTYDLHGLPQALVRYPELIQPAHQAIAYLPVEPEYARWSAERHR